MSSSTLAWLKDELQSHPDAPTIVFFHAPLKGTLQSANEASERPSFIAQPEDKIRELILKNPQVFMWVSGHVHLAATNTKFADKVNVYEGQVTDIHNGDMDGRSYLKATDAKVTEHDDIWTNSLFLYPDKVVVKTYDHRRSEWLEALTRTILPNTKKS
jgi:hypothetical protein